MARIKLGHTVQGGFTTRGLAAETPMSLGASVRSFWNHPAGPKTIFFWAPTFKWGITLANVSDFKRPPELLSYPQQLAVTLTGLIWTRYSTVITPVNYNLMTVNIAMAATGLYQLYRKIGHDVQAKPAAQSGSGAPALEGGATA